MQELGRDRPVFAVGSLFCLVEQPVDPSLDALACHCAAIMVAAE